jgi:hypothetical protein
MAALLLAVPLEIRPPRQPVDPDRAALIAWRIRQAVPFLLYLVLITFVPVYHGVRVLATRRNPEQLRTPLHTTLNLLAIAGSVAMLSLGLWFRQPVFLALSPVGFLLGRNGLSFARKPCATPMAWWYEHMNAMLGGGIAFHTAFLVLGAGRLLNFQLDGAWAAVPWVLPTVIGVPATSIWIRHYRQKFGESAPRPARVAA